MFLTLQVVTVFLTAVAMSLPLAHALELPGKMRLDKETYTAVQAIGGLGEGLAMLSTLALLLMTPSRPAFWWLFIGFVAFVAMQAAYWVQETWIIRPFTGSESSRSCTGLRLPARHHLNKVRTSSLGRCRARVAASTAATPYVAGPNSA